MWLENDLQQFLERGITEKEVNEQLKRFEQGFPFLKIQDIATFEKGILQLSQEQQESCIEEWHQYKSGNHKITKFVPASGAASRMFKDLFAFLEATYDVPTTAFEKKFFENIHKFAFFDALNDACELLYEGGVDYLISQKMYKEVVSGLLDEEGLNYGNLPKGLLQFHAYNDFVRTPVEEHLEEGALYSCSQGETDIHFTVSDNHKHLFEEMLSRAVPQVEQAHHVTCRVSLSTQLPKTDTIAVNPDNTPFRNEDGTLLFRPGGHGSLIHNLNEQDSDIVFIKNIDNVVPDRLKESTILWKEILAGKLVKVQKQVFAYLNLLESGQYSHSDLENMIRLVRHTLNCDLPHVKHLEDTELLIFLKKKLNRPIRVCGMVKNEGEPGGGPFWTLNSDQTVSLQILESSQIDSTDERAMGLFRQGTHFNPVDLVCAIKDYKGHKFDLTQYVDHETGFISNKSKNGRALKALELPGLWNGAMSDWSTIMVNVPISTFNPVKTVNDLLRDEHQG